MSNRLECKLRTPLAWVQSIPWLWINKLLYSITQRTGLCAFQKLKSRCFNWIAPVAGCMEPRALTFLHRGPWRVLGNISHSPPLTFMVNYGVEWWPLTDLWSPLSDTATYFWSFSDTCIMCLSSKRRHHAEDRSFAEWTLSGMRVK